jgi:hypothetical protein
MFKKIISILLVTGLLLSPVSSFADTWGQTKPPLGSQIDWAHPLSRGLVGAWLMNEGGGKIVKNMCNNTTGTIYGSMIWSKGKKGNTLLITTTTGKSYIDTSLIFKAGTSSLSFVLGYRKTDGVYRNPYTLSSKEGDAANDRLLLALPYSDGNIYFDVGDATENSGRIVLNMSGIVLGNDLWVFNASGKGREIWQNGILKKSNNGNAVLPTQKTLCIGSGYAENYGDLAEYWIFLAYNRALSPQEIQQLYIDPYCFIKRSYKLYYAPAGGATNDVWGWMDGNATTDIFGMVD